MSRDPICRYDHRAMVILDPDREWVFAADPLGRVTWVHTPEAMYRRSRFNQWHRLKKRQWSSLEPVEETEIETAVESWKTVWERARLRATGSLSQRLETWLDRFMDFHQEDARHFHSIYQHIPILPPDAYQSLYIQLSSGCPWNRCTFCSFYRDRDYRVTPMDELRRHLEAVRTYWGEALGSRSGFFLGDANAIAISTEALLERCRLVREFFPEKPAWDLFSFSDFFTAPKRARQDFRRLRELGLSRVCFGVESGDVNLLEEIDKPMKWADIVGTIREARFGGVQVSLILIVGLGGHRHRDSHFRSSMKLLSQLSLSRRDRVYLSPLTLEPRLDYVAMAEDKNWGHLDDGELALEMNRWKDSISQLNTNLSSSLYNIRLFTY